MNLSSFYNEDEDKFLIDKRSFKMSSTTVKILNNEEQFVHVAVDLAKNYF